MSKETQFRYLVIWGLRILILHLIYRSDNKSLSSVSIKTIGDFFERADAYMQEIKVNNANS